MQTVYHSKITTQALSSFFSASALETVIAGNLGQDHLFRGQIGHPEYHFDQDAFKESWDYIEKNRVLIRPALEGGHAQLAQRALGRLIHAGQDLYAHSNYVSLWLSRFPGGKWPIPDEMDPFDHNIFESPDLISGKIYLPLEPLSWVPLLKGLLLPLLPRDSHAWMNLDTPQRGPMFQYALIAAVKRTRYEFEKTVQGLPQELHFLFCGKSLPPHAV
jgi:hypothetical protein